MNVPTTRQIAVALGLALAATLPAGVLVARRPALRQAFPGATIEPRDLFPTLQQVKAVEAAARAPLGDQLVTVYEARNGGEIVGYGIFDTRPVRSHTATTLVTLSPDGAVEQVRVCAFHEPREYQPVERWFHQLIGRPVSARLEIGEDIAAITGATMSARAFAEVVRRARAIHQVLLAPAPRHSSSE